MPRTPNFGTKTYVSTVGVNGPWTFVQDIKAFAPPSRQKAEIDATSLDQSLKTFIGGIAEGQQWNFDLMLNSTAPEQAALLTAFDTETPLWFRFRDDRAAVTEELVIGFTVLGNEFSMGENEQIRMVKVSGRISSDFAYRSKTAV